MKSSLMALAVLASISTTGLAVSAAHADHGAKHDTAANHAVVVNDDIRVPVYTGPAGSANIAVSGYDAVSYFTGNGTPVKGSAAHTVRYDGVDYHFANAQNAAKFQAAPAKYAPQYGGHCAFAASKGALAPGDPTLARVVDGKLYLNYNEAVQQRWLSDIPGYIKTADQAFSKIPANARFDD